jgi:O-antigen ligase
VATKQKHLLLTSLLCLLPIFLALLNTSYWGIPTLSAYFGFVISVTIIVIIISISGVKNKFRVTPIPVLVFLLFILYIFAHGLWTGTVNFSHYYWVACGLWLLICCMMRSSVSISLLYGIAFIALGESLIVLLQTIGILASKNPFFLCTGTWINPNVTAMFLAMSLFGIVNLGEIAKNKIILRSLLLTTIAAICLLQCRSAYLVAAILLAGYYSRNIREWLFQKWKFNPRVISFSLAAFFIAFAFLLSFSFKETSSAGRIHIWKNSLACVMDKPIAGHGFGLFERAYNLYIAEQSTAGAGHVYMPYNDYIELGVEGGIPAILLWLAFMVSLFIYNRRNKISVLPMLAFSIIQLTNFGFQAIPAFILFLLYIGFDNFHFLKQNEKLPAVSFAIIRPARDQLAFLIPVSLIAVFLFYFQVKQATALRKVVEIKENEPASFAVNEYLDIEPVLSGNSYFHEGFGDAFVQLKQFRPALQQYLQALHFSAKESIIGKIGYCYQQERRYDSSEYYFTILQNMVPSKFSPRMALLSLYEQKGDTTSMLSKATEIRDMPVKVESNEITQIKNYATSLLNQVRK